ncbi:MAG: sulfite exporter TauE/SafE family protein [Bacilli bacterium]|nr:sulfite exporter TauE/SafE family protein [Bacilli bacterium]
MKKIYVKIDGITCEHCKSKLTKALLKVENVESVSFQGHIAELFYKNKISKKEIEKKVKALDYYTDEKMMSAKRNNIKNNISWMEVAKIGGILILLAFSLNYLFGFNIFNMIPVIDSKTTLAMLFVTGLLTSIHCVSMCGAINLAVSSSKNKNYKKPIFYNLGRLTSYTVLGGMIGLLGSIFKINIYFQSFVIIVASVCMFIMALNMMGVISFTPKIKWPKWMKKIRGKGPFTIGLLNGLMPCGPLQAMQVYALSTGSFFYGAASMFLFCLGTIPLMLFVGILSNFLNQKNRIILNKISTVLILLLSLVMLNRGLLGMGVDLSVPFKPNTDGYLKSEIKENYQEVKFDLSYSGYKDIVIQKDVPVKMIIHADQTSLTGCNNAIKINAFKVEKSLVSGDNVIEFTPNKTGNYTYTCWMGMLKNNILVVDDIKALK